MLLVRRQVHWLRDLYRGLEVFTGRKGRALMAYWFNRKVFHRRGTQLSCNWLGYELSGNSILFLGLNAHSSSG